MELHWPIRMLSAFAMLLALFCGQASAQSPPRRITILDGAIEVHRKKGAPLQIDEADVVSIKTRYALVQYPKVGSWVAVNGTLVRNSANVDALTSWGYFKVGNEDVLLFEGANRSSSGLQGDTYFLILMPDKQPKIVQAPIEAGDGSIKKVWQVGSTIYVAFEVGDYDVIASPLKFTADKVITEPRTPSFYSKNGPALKEDDCRGAYDISLNDCSTKFTRGKQECSTTPNSIVGQSRSDMHAFTLLSRLPGFNEKSFNEYCSAWCEGKKVSFEQFSSAVCNIK